MAYSLTRFQQIEQQYHLTKAQLVEKQAQLAQVSTWVALDESEVVRYEINLRGFDQGLHTAVERLNRAKHEYCNIKMICDSHSVGGDTTNKTTDPTCDSAVSYTNWILGDHNWHQMWCAGRRKEGRGCQQQWTLIYAQNLYSYLLDVFCYMYQVLLCPLTMITVSCSLLILNLYRLIEYADIKRWKFATYIVTLFNIGASFKVKLDWVPRGRNWWWKFMVWDNPKSLQLYSWHGCSDYSFQPHHYGLLCSRWGCLNDLHRIKLCFVASESQMFVIKVEMQAKSQ